MPNESAKTQRFLALVSELFPGSDIVGLISQGIEKRVRLGTKRRRIDSYFGNALIEFEKSLDVSLTTAEKQLREQVAGLWNGDESPDRPLVAIASDGIRWECYRPRVARRGAPSLRARGRGSRPLPRDPSRRENVSAFWFWLTGLLFREGSIRPDAQRFRHDFGSTSLAYHDTIRALERVWKTVGAAGEAQVAFETWRRYLNVTYGQLADAGAERASEDTTLLFLKHTYLAVLARFLVWASLRGVRPLKGSARSFKTASPARFFTGGTSPTWSRPTSSSGCNCPRCSRCSPRTGNESSSRCSAMT